MYGTFHQEVARQILLKSVDVSRNYLKTICPDTICPARCTPDAAAQLQPIPYACGAQRALLPVAVGAMNIHDVRDRRQKTTDVVRRASSLNAPLYP